MLSSSAQISDAKSPHLTSASLPMKLSRPNTLSRNLANFTSITFAHQKQRHTESNNQQVLLLSVDAKCEMREPAQVSFPIPFSLCGQSVANLLFFCGQLGANNYHSVCELARHHFLLLFFFFLAQQRERESVWRHSFAACRPCVAIRRTSAVEFVRFVCAPTQIRAFI